MEKMSVGVIGATGMVGQNYLRLLKNHPWFEVTHVAASPRSAGKPYAEAVAGRWVMDEDIPEAVTDLIVGDAGNVAAAKGKCELVFSAVDMDKQAVRELEEAYAANDIAVVSNNSAHRWTADVPMFIPEVNPHHADIIPFQRRNHGWTKGLIAVKPNCSLQSYLPAVYPLMAAGYAVESIFVATLQGVSGAGYPGPASIDMIDNVVPFIGGEEEKTEQEPLKILGTIKDGRFVNDGSLTVAAHCNRVPVTHGHRLRQPKVQGAKAVAGRDHRDLARFRGRAAKARPALRPQAVHHLPGGAGPAPAAQGPGRRRGDGDHRRAAA